ncbi:MAG: hypothetical protein ABSC36_01140 [Gaiellaceae bacterium]|jgi:hypothetical protein
MRLIPARRPGAPWRLRRKGLALLAALAIAATLGAIALAGVFSSSETVPRAKQGMPAVSVRTLKALERIRRQTKQPPLYYLGLRYEGLPLVGVNRDPYVSLVYADCTMLELSTLSPACRRVVWVNLERPAPGEITTQGRCTFSNRTRGATVALFPGDGQTLRVFTKETTVYISSFSRSLRDELAAARALRGLNVRLAASEPLPSRDISRQLGRCRTPKQQTPLTRKQLYQEKMQRSWAIVSTSTLILPAPANLDNPSARQMFFAGVGTFPLLLRNEAARLGAVSPPADVADLQAKLIAELRAYADDVDLSLELIRSGAWHDKPTYMSKRKELDARFKRCSNAIGAIVTSFRKRGYVIAQEVVD